MVDRRLLVGGAWFNGYSGKAQVANDPKDDNRQYQFSCLKGWGIRVIRITYDRRV